MENTRRLNIEFAILCLVVGICLIFFAITANAVEAVCEHPNMIEERIDESTCFTNGTYNIMCSDCGFIELVVQEKKLEHNLSNYKLVEPAGINKNGRLEAVCQECDYVSTLVYVCRHDFTYEKVVAEPTCDTQGLTLFLCQECHTTVSYTSEDALGHMFGNWKITKYASPDAKGVKERVCANCEKSETTSYEFSLGKNAIYISGTSINANIVPCDLTQSNCDKYDMIYGASYMGCAGPWILGHNTRTLGRLSQTKVGAMIYLSVNGSVRTYQVKISEFAMQNDSWTDIVGQSSGKSIFANMGAETLRMYSCYGGTNGRWIVLATRVS